VGIWIQLQRVKIDVLKDDLGALAEIDLDIAVLELLGVVQHISGILDAFETALGNLDDIDANLEIHDRVLAGAFGEHERVGTFATGQLVLALAAIEEVVATEPEELVLALLAEQEIRKLGYTIVGVQDVPFVGSGNRGHAYPPYDESNR
jgi:hypothetical protein